MPLWGKNNQAVTANSTTTAESTSGEPIGVYTAVKGDQVNRVNSANAHFGNTSSGSRAAVDSALFGNSTPGAFIPGMTVGVVSSNSSTANTMPGSHAGWQIVRSGTGPIVGATVNTPGTGFANGETLTFSNGSSNATGVAVTNATGNLVSVTVSGGAGFANAASVAVAFNREKHLSAITVGGTPVGYSNTDVIVASNGISNAAASVSTNSTGGFVTANVSITNPGLFSNTFVAGNVAFTVKAANGSASAGSGATFTATLANSSSGAVTAVLGGRAGRVHYETLIASGSNV
jgi:ribosomal protein S11